MSVNRTSGPDLNKYMNKQLSLKLNGSRRVTGRLRGFDQFMNLVLEDTIEHKTNNNNQANTANDIESLNDQNIGSVVIRGNSVLMIEALEKI